MSNPDVDKTRQVAAQIASRIDFVEKQTLARWIEDLIEIKSCGLPALERARRAISLSASSTLMIATVKMVGREIKRHGWDNRSRSARFGLSGAAVGLAVFGGQGAGIAALGTAIGVPLWVIFGAGAAFMGVLYEEITGHRLKNNASYQVIEAEKIDQTSPKDVERLPGNERR
jgi:hypothetical protein